MSRICSLSCQMRHTFNKVASVEHSLSDQGEGWGEATDIVASPLTPLPLGRGELDNIFNLYCISV